MIMKIERDQRRFRQIVRGKIRQHLRKYVTHGEMIGRKGKDPARPIATLRGVISAPPLDQ